MGTSGHLWYTCTFFPSSLRQLALSPISCLFKNNDGSDALSPSLSLSLSLRAFPAATAAHSNARAGQLAVAVDPSLKRRDALHDGGRAPHAFMTPVKKKQKVEADFVGKTDCNSTSPGIFAAKQAEHEVKQKPGSADVNPGRIQTLQSGSESREGPVVYWMSREQRTRDNWGLLYAAQQARQRGSLSPLVVVFNLTDTFLEARARHFGFMLRGLKVVQRNLKALDIPFFLLKGKAEDTIPAFLQKCNAAALVMDFSPLRIGRTWRNEVTKAVDSSVSVYEVDAHNIVPVWVASNKQEYNARTIRGKINKLLPEFLLEFPTLEAPKVPWTEAEAPEVINWDSLIEETLRWGAEVPEVTWCEPGEDAALEVLLGKHNGFLTKRIRSYAGDRNDPNKRSALSNLSPYLHFGQIAAQRCALEGHRVRNSFPKDIDAFLEELVIRRELADNFCFYQPHYDNIQGAADWARKTLLDHASDKREYIYIKEQLEKGKTHDELWNAAQLEMVHFGKMHGFMRMYWAKKILEWTRSPEEALEISIYLNDKYELDGRDPSGYVGCMWSICGIHDQGWQERPVFGKIRYMNYKGCKRKFDVDGYVAYTKKRVADLKKKVATSLVVPPLKAI